MKPFFCINGDIKGAKALNGSEFIKAKVSETLLADYKNAISKNKEINKKAETPQGLRVLEVFCALVAALSIGSALRPVFYKETAVNYGISDYIWLILTVIVCIALFYVTEYFGKKRKNKILESEETKLNILKVKELTEKMEAELGVPEEAELCEVLAFPYSEKDNRIKILEDKKSGLKRADNCKFKLYKEQESLVLCALDKKFGFDLESLKCLKTEKEKLCLSYWHRPVNFNDESLKEFNLKQESGKVIINEYLSLYFEHGEEENKEIWTINFPIYEKEKVERITGFKAD